MPQQVLTPEWVQQLIHVIRDQRPIIYSDGGLTVFSSHGFHTAPGNKYGMALIQGFQDPIGLQANSIEYAYVRYVDSQLVVSTNLPNLNEALLIATIYTDTYKVTQIINHMVELPDTSGLPILPEIPPPPPTTPPYQLPQHLKGSISIFIEKPKVKNYMIDVRAPYSYNLKSVSSKTASGTMTFSLLNNGTVIPQTSNLSAGQAVTITPFSTAIPIAEGDQLSLTINTLTSTVDVGITIYVYGSSQTLISNTL